MILKQLPSPPIVYCFGGSDPSGGAGVQADLKTVTAMGAHACTLLTSLTAQNSAQVSQISDVSPEFFNQQINILREQYPPQAIKIGMLGHPNTIGVLAGYVKTTGAPCVYDSVMRSSSGKDFLSDDQLQKIRKQLLPYVSVFTPNLVEAERWVGYRLYTPSDIERAAHDLLGLGARAVVIKGGHGTTDFSSDFFTDGKSKFWIASPRINAGQVRGTGCTHSSALATALAFGYDSLDSAIIAKIFMNSSLRQVQTVGKGCGILQYSNLHPSPADLPVLLPQHQPPASYRFPSCGPEPLGFYPVIDSYSWLEKLLPLGVKTAQLRIKNLTGLELETEIAKSIALGKKHACRLFINDFWELAIRLGAYGVHLGQEDLDTASVDAIARAGLRLGVSTHSYAEIARAHALRPSYIAIGPVFSTTLKQMRFGPQGLYAFRNWSKLLDYPVVAIGGIKLETSGDLFHEGADGIAVVSDITQNSDPEGRTLAWLGALDRN